jgi:hypothetical protein
MAENRKKTQQPLYKDPGWGDSVSVSKKAREELAEISNNTEQQVQPEEYTQKKTAQLKTPANYSNAIAKRTDKLGKAGSNIKSEVNTQVEHLNKEINKAVSEIENVFERFLNQLSSAVSNFFLALYNLLLRILLLVFVEPIKNIGKFSNMFLNLLNDSLDDFNNWVSGTSKPKKKAAFQETSYESSYQASNPKQKAPTAPLTTHAPIPEPKEDPMVSMQKRYPAVFDGIIFGELAKKGIVFLNIKNATLYDEKRTDFSVEEEQELLDKGIKEINNCARLAKNLPSPTKGRYVSRPMEEILENAGMNDLKAFLQYVYTHPKPFIERRLRLSEAFATWAHKGAPV